MSGAAVFSASIAPTEEMVLLAAKMSELNALLLIAFRLFDLRRAPSVSSLTFGG